MNTPEREAVLATIEEYLAFLELATWDSRSNHFVPRALRLPLAAFKNAEPLACPLGRRTTMFLYS
jgi:hypothetical protein